ncbi:MAG: hypothetical protein GX587_12935 [Bacteroidales bacterium]|nr:hypothetical protein [Bacteroidales bacterium]
MKRIKHLVFLILLVSFGAQAQVNVGENIQLKFHGYVAHEVIFDTYRSLDSRDGELYYYPLKAVFDDNGVDINKKSKLNMIEVQSRFGMQVKGPDVLGAKATGLLEADFYGTNQSYVRMLRVRHAYVNLNWGKHELLAGSTFHPAFVQDCFPSTVSFAAGVPFHPLNRSPQLRYTFRPVPNFKVSASFLIHGYHRSSGPTEAQKNSGKPDSQLNVQFGDGKNVAIGLVAGYKWLTPRDVTNSGLETSETIGSYNVQAYLKYKLPFLSVKLEGMYGENLTNFVMIGGYGIKGVAGEVDENGDYSYANMRTMSAWADFETSTKLQLGLFAGYTSNLGSKDDYIVIPTYNRNDDLHYVYRLSPRLVYKVSNLSFGLEWSYVTAVYGREFDSKRKVTSDLDPVSNNHIIFQTKYSF